LVLVSIYSVGGYGDTVWLIRPGNYLILPLGLVYGRRPTAIGSIVVLFVATIGCAVSQTFEQHLGLRCLQGLATGATESVSIIDLFYCEVDAS
jgi:MFS family permease